MTFRRGQYQRNTSTTGRVVDTGPPRTNQGLTGLGAVGGPTGVGAGALRVIVEFLTQYDSDELKQLEGELFRLQKVEDRHNTRMSALKKSEAQSQGAITRLRNIEQRAELNFTGAQQKEIKKIRDLERTRGKDAKDRARAAKELLATQTGFSKSEISQLVNADRIRSKAEQRRAAFAERTARAEANIAKNQQQQANIGQRVGRLQQLRTQLAPKLGSLALGAIGGVFGGAIVGLGFAAAQVLIDAVGQALKDVVDPANRAREAVGGVADAVNKIAEKEGITTLQAATKYLKDLGPAAAGISPEIIAASVVVQQLTEDVEALIAAREVAAHAPELIKEQQLNLIRQMVKELGQGGGAGARSFANLKEALDTGDTSRLSSQELQIYNSVIDQTADSSDRAANAQARLAAQERGAAQAAAIAEIAQSRLVSALQRISGLRVSGLQDQLSAIQDAGPSARTQALQTQLEGMAEAQSRAAAGAQLAQIQEERSLVLLEQRVRFQGESVRLDTLSARGQLVAIDARISSLQKAGEAERANLDAVNDTIDALRKADQEQDKRDQAALKVFDDQIDALREKGEAQDRFNRLLDLQYQLGQTIKRQEGESIADFVSRRANETRQLLAQQASLGREGQIGGLENQRDALAATQEVANARREAAIEQKQLEADALQQQIERIEKGRAAEIDALNQRKDQLQLEVRLQELAEQEKQVAAQETARKRTKAIQDALKASQDADAKETKSRQDAINDQVEAEQKKLERLLYYTDQENLTRLQQAVAGARTYGDMNTISGEIAGAKRVLGELRALVAAGVLPASMVSDRIANLVTIIRSAEAKLGSVVSRMPRPATPGGTPSGRIPFAEGGAFWLNNAMNAPFSNMQVGESGKEIGVVLSNRVAKVLQDQSRSPIPSMPVTVNRSTDPWADEQRARRLIKKTVQEMLSR